MIARDVAVLASMNSYVDERRKTSHLNSKPSLFKPADLFLNFIASYLTRYLI